MSWYIGAKMARTGLNRRVLHHEMLHDNVVKSVKCTSQMRNRGQMEGLVVSDDCIDVGEGC